MSQLTVNSTMITNNSTMITNTSTMPPNTSTMITTEEYIILSLLVLLGFLIVCINCFVIYLVVKENRLKTVTNFCLASLALSDMLSGVYVIPLIVACHLYWQNDDCISSMDLGQRFLSISTILHLLLITVERYITIVHTFHSNSLFRKRSCVFILLGLWGFSLMASLIQLAFPSGQQLERAEIIYDIVLLIVIVALPLLVMIYAYGHIFYTIKRHCNQIKRDISHLSEDSAERCRQKERKAITIYGTMLVVFVVGWFSYFFNSLRIDLDSEQLQLPFWADTFLMFLRFSTSLFNPMLYTFLKHDFRRARKSVRFCPCLEGRCPSFRRDRPSGKYLSSERDTLPTASSAV